jgi:hypothetical protein
MDEELTQEDFDRLEEVEYSEDNYSENSNDVEEDFQDSNYDEDAQIGKKRKI